MANALYGLSKQKFLEGSIDLISDTINCVLVDLDDYVPNLTTDEFLDDITAGARIATATLAGKDVSLGVFDANNITFTSVSGDEAEALVIYKNTGVDSTSPLIAIIDTATGLPIIPGGGDIVVTWDSGVNKIFAL